MDENENFEALRRLLALKRHEIPPPGYHHNFSSQVISRLRLGEHRSNDTAQEMPWFLRFIQLFDAKPAFAGVFASALCLLLVFGIVNAERPDVSASQPLLMQTADNTAPIGSVTSTAVTPSSQPAAQPMLALNSTNPILDLQATAQQAVPVNVLFNGQTPVPQEATFTPPGQ
ncbi:MAG TPA: hypothetical protein VGI03_03885 [Verrucomicrobiae bacterium]|jgi:hypothetical protein